jgi:hypothetical protein
MISEPQIVPEIDGGRYIDFSCGDNFTLFKVHDVKASSKVENQEPQYAYYSCGLNNSG